MKKGIELIKHFESLHDGDLRTIGLQPKLCPAGVWTEGWGRAMVDPATRSHLRGANNRRKALQLSTIKTEAEAEKALAEDMIRLGQTPAIRHLTQSYWNRLNIDQQGALVSFVYNCGTGSPTFRIFRNIQLWLDKKKTSKALADYWANSVIRASGRVQPGLVRRRQTEAVLFLTGKLQFTHTANWNTF